MLKDNDIELYSTHNEENFVVERFTKTFKSKICKCTTLITKNVYIIELDDIVNEYNNTYHRVIKVKPVDVKSGNYFEFNLNSSDKDPKFQVGDHVIISKCKTFLKW